MTELEYDANCIIELLATADSEFSGVVEILDSCDINTISQWISEAMDLIYNGDGPPDIDDDTCDDDDYDSFNTLGASDGACMVTAVITQWLVRYMCKKLMQLITPEAVILKRKYVMYNDLVMLIIIINFNHCICFLDLFLFHTYKFI